MVEHVFEIVLDALRSVVHRSCNDLAGLVDLGLLALLGDDLDLIPLDSPLRDDNWGGGVDMSCE